MAGSRKLGPLGLNPEIQDLSDGTMIRGLSPHPGPNRVKVASIVNAHGKPSVAPRITPDSRKKTSKAEIPVLLQGNQGPNVKRLQQLLNSRITPSPKLAVDGMFGPLTHQAVLHYQKSISIAVDGIVGKQTWYQLLKGDKVSVIQVSVFEKQSATSGTGAPPKSPTTVQPAKIAPLSPAVEGIWVWPLEDKFAGVLRRTAPKLPGSMRHEFEALLSPTNRKIMAGTLVIWAGHTRSASGKLLMSCYSLVGLSSSGWLFLMLRES